MRSFNLFRTAVVAASLIASLGNVGTALADTMSAPQDQVQQPMSAVATNFSGIPPMPGQEDYVPSGPATQKLTQFPADPPVQMHRNDAQTGPYDSPDFVVPPYEIQP
jgi:hypothetical protein